MDESTMMALVQKCTAARNLRMGDRSLQSLQTLEESDQLEDCLMYMFSTIIEGRKEFISAHRTTNELRVEHTAWLQCATDDYMVYEGLIQHMQAQISLQALELDKQMIQIHHQELQIKQQNIPLQTHCGMEHHQTRRDTNNELERHCAPPKHTSILLDNVD
jgi:hypothetical protein